jgi:hypothetical protein
MINTVGHVMSPIGCLKPQLLAMILLPSASAQLALL